MLGKQKIWDIQEYNREKAGFYAAELGISSLVTGILLERGFNDVDSMREFLYGSKEPFHNPFLLKGMEATVARVEKALENGERLFPEISLSMICGTVSYLWMIIP